MLVGVLRVVEGPELALRFGPGSRAEVPLAGLVYSVAGPQVIAGQVDRLLLEESTVWLIDYKSQRPAPTESADVPIVYLRQMAAYRAFLARIYPGREVRCFLFWTEGPRRVTPSDAIVAGPSPLRSDEGC